MTNLTYELLRNCTTLVKINYLNELCSYLNDKKCDVYGLRAEFGFPEHLIPPNNQNFLAYIGISKKKVETSYGQAHFVSFSYEPKTSMYHSPIGILDHMYNMYMIEQQDKLSEDAYKEGENFSVELFPGKITKKTIGYWRWVLDNDWSVCDKISMDDLIDDYEIKGHVNWDELYNILPENIDDVSTESEEESENEEEMNSDEEETDDELEDGELVLSDSET